MLGWFLILKFLRLYGALGKDTLDFLITYKDKFYNLGIVETRGVDYTTFQIELVA